MSNLEIQLKRLRRIWQTIKRCIDDFDIGSYDDLIQFRMHKIKKIIKFIEDDIWNYKELVVDLEHPPNNPMHKDIDVYQVYFMLLYELHNKGIFQFSIDILTYLNSLVLDNKIYIEIDDDRETFLELIFEITHIKDFFDRDSVGEINFNDIVYKYLLKKVFSPKSFLIRDLTK